jgi:MFS transporter, putative metabolite:H+ symporter
MPHVRRRLDTAFAAPAAEVQTAVADALNLTPDADGFSGLLSGTTGLAIHVTLDRDTTSGDTTVRFEAASRDSIPYFGWFVNLLRRVEAGRELRYCIARVNAALDGTDAPDPPRRISLLPPVAFTEEQTRRLAAIALVAASASFCGALFTQNGDAVTDTFHRSDADLGWALAISRVGVLVSLVAAGLSDRFGRRRTLIICVGGAAIANGITAVAPTFGVFTVAQLFTRAFVNAVLVIAGLAAVEEAPEGARAFALSMFGLAFGLGFSLSVVLLPLADLGDDGWRIAFAASALVVLVIPSLRRHLRETTRYKDLEARSVQRGRIREVFDRKYGRRFVMLGLVAFLTNVFQAPSSQLANRYLHREHDFSNSETALFRTVTAGVPGIVGVVAGGRLSESRGRRPVTIIGLVIASAFQMSFFLSGGGVWLWIAPIVAIVAALAGGLALGALDTELFPTEVRGTSNGFLLVCGVTGSVVGLVVATNIKNAVGGLGPAIALCGIAPVIAALFIVPRLPETVDRTLDEISPTENTPPEPLGGTA